METKKDIGTTVKRESHSDGLGSSLKSIETIASPDVSDIPRSAN